jgi:NAD(P)-dependent dehydrogenase (short-subunit alcohol dehydrogenase family)
MKANYDFSGGVVLITGGANGMGAALARACSEAGATVVVADVDDDAAQALADAAAGPGTIEAVHLDVSDPAAVTEVLAGIKERHGLVCAAIVQPLGDVLETSPEQFRRAIDINFYGVVWCCQAVAPIMIEQRGGSIVVFASGVATMGKRGSAPYTASKGAVVGFQKTLAIELKEHNVRVNAIRPGVVNTPQFVAANPQGIPKAILDQPEDVVGGLMFLLSDDAMMTGSTVAREMSYSRAREEAAV